MTKEPDGNQSKIIIFDSGELMPDSVVRKFRTVAVNVKPYDMSFYNLDMIISLG